MTESIMIRPALAQDKDAILAFCQNTFSWGDYIPELWDDWLCDARGQLFVAILSNQPVGLMHVQLLDDGVAWIEGLRVHPSFRRRGVASGLIVAGHTYAIKKQRNIIRLATGTDNIASQQLFGSHGYARIAEYGWWSAEPARTESASVQVASERDRARIVDLWSRVTYSHIVANSGWQWITMSEDALGNLIPAGEARVLPNGFSIVRDMDYSTPCLHALVGDKDAMCTLALAARAQAGYRGMKQIEALIVDDVAVNRALVDAGFQREGGMFVYEQTIAGLDRTT